MATEDADRFEAWYSHKLWQLLPAIYRAEDAADPRTKGPLRELVERIGAQAAVVRRSIDRLWEDQSIETCDEWLIDYFADLLATNVVSGLDEQQRRVDVGKTIYYRRRKGTVALLEELASDITGWSVHVVEFFRRMSRTRHLLDPAIGLRTFRDTDVQRDLQEAQGLVAPRSRTQAGGFADLRNVLAASQAPGQRTDTRSFIGGAFDEYFHTGDVRRGVGATGWYGISKLGVFVWRLEPRAVMEGTPVAVDDEGDDDHDCPVQYTFDPTGRDLPLFGSGERDYGNQWISPAPFQVPGPISKELLEAAFTNLYGKDLAICVRDPLGPIPATRFAKRPDPADPTATPLWIDPLRGRFYVHLGQAYPGPFLVDYHSAFSADVGASSHDHRGDKTFDDAGTTGVSAGGTALEVALSTLGSGTLDIPETLKITDSLTYSTVAPLTGIVNVALRAQNMKRPVIRAKTDEWELQGKDASSKLELTGLFISGGIDVVLSGTFDTVTLRYCTLDPGQWDADEDDWALAVDGVELAPSRLVIRGEIRNLVIENCILGPIVSRSKKYTPSIRIDDSIIQNVEDGELAIELVNGDIALSRCTLLGGGEIHRLDASESILHDKVIVDDLQHGCIRFSAYTDESLLPRKYESIETHAREVPFNALDFGQAAYAQLSDIAPLRIREGAKDGSEMGAFASAKASIRERSILIKFAEYLPVGLEPVIVHVT